VETERDIEGDFFIRTKANRARTSETKCIDYSRWDFVEPADVSLIASRVDVLSVVSIDSGESARYAGERMKRCMHVDVHSVPLKKEREESLMAGLIVSQDANVLKSNLL
jgi:hypothetical protein